MYILNALGDRLPIAWIMSEGKPAANAAAPPAGAGWPPT